MYDDQDADLPLEPTLEDGEEEEEDELDGFRIESDTGEDEPETL